MRGVGIQNAAGVFHVRIELTACDVLRAFKEEVLKKVGHARAVGPLVFGTDMVQHGDCDKRGGVVLVEDDVEAVVQIEFGELDLASLGLAPCSGRDQGRGCAEEQEGGESHVGKLSLQDSDLGVSCLHGNEPSRRSGSARPRAGTSEGWWGADVFWQLSHEDGVTRTLSAEAVARIERCHAYLLGRASGETPCMASTRGLAIWPRPAWTTSWGCSETC